MVNIGTLAVANNLLIPAGIVVNVIFWNRDADIVRLAIGGGIILLALWVNDKFNQRHLRLTTPSSNDTPLAKTQ